MKNSNPRAFQLNFNRASWDNRDDSTFNFCETGNGPIKFRYVQR